MKLKRHQQKTIFLEEWVVDIEKSSNYITSVFIEHRDEEGSRNYDLEGNFTILEVDELENRFDLYTKEGLQYHFNLSEEGSIIGDIFDDEGELVDSFAMFNVYD